MRDVILHAFNWQYQEIIDKIEDIHAAGYGAILIAPPVYSDRNNEKWWQRYQPKDYRVLLSCLGGKKNLEELIRLCHEANPSIRVYADVVINHMANEYRDDHFSFPGKAELENYKNNRALFEENRLYGNLDHGLFSTYDFNHSGEIEDHEWLNRIIVQTQRLAELPDLKDSPWVLSQQRELFAGLAKMNFDGFRVDAIKHITERMVDNFADQDYMAGKYIFGEVLTFNEEEERIFLRPFLRETWISAYDCPLFDTIKSAFGLGGSLKKLAHPEYEGNALPWDRAVTFVVNHDFPNNNMFRGNLLNRKDEHLAYVYILGRDGGVPLIYSDHNESAEEHSEDRGRWADAHRRNDIVNMIDFHNRVHGSRMYSLYESENILVFRRGEMGIVAINKCAEESYIHFDTWGLKNPWHYKDLLSGNEMNLSGDHFTLLVPPRTAQMWLAASR